MKHILPLTAPPSARVEVLLRTYKITFMRTMTVLVITLLKFKTLMTTITMRILVIMHQKKLLKFKTIMTMIMMIMVTMIKKSEYLSQRTEVEVTPPPHGLLCRLLIRKYNSQF